MPPDSFSSALGQLDPASRALLDLSLRRGMRTEEIAEMLGAEPWNVALSRDDALRRVVVAVGKAGGEGRGERGGQRGEVPAGGGGGPGDRQRVGRGWGAGGGSATEIEE